MSFNIWIIFWKRSLLQEKMKGIYTYQKKKHEEYLCPKEVRCWTQTCEGLLLQYQNYFIIFNQIALILNAR